MRYRTTKLWEVEECREIYMKKNRNEEERKRGNKLQDEAEEKKQCNNRGRNWEST